MNMGYIERQNKWTAENRDRISLLVPKGEKEIIKKFAEKYGESLNAYINRAIQEQINRDKVNETPTDSLRADFLAKLNAAQPTVQAPSPVPKVQPAQPKTEIEQVDWHGLCMKAREAQEEKRKEDII